MGRTRKRQKRIDRSDVPTATIESEQRAADDKCALGGLDVWLALSIWLVAFGLRAVFVLQMRDSPLFAHPIMDELYHDQWAQAIADGKTYIEGPYFRAPLYPLFLATIYKVFGHGFLLPRLIQAALGAFSCVLLFLIGRRIFSRTVSVVAAFVAAGYWVLIYFDGELLIPSLVVFLDLLLIWLLLGLDRKPQSPGFVLAGMVLGASAIARPNILLFAPVIALWLLVRHRHQLRQAIGYVSLLAIGCFMLILPVTIRNYAAGNDFVLISSQAGVNFYIGNNPDSDGSTAIVPGTHGGWWEGHHQTIERAELAAGRALKPSEVSRYYFAESLKFMVNEPGSYLSLLWLKTRLFWTRWEISNNKGIYFWAERFAPITRRLPLGFAVIGPLGALGLLLCIRRGAATFPLWGFVLVYMATVVAFFCTSRYRVPVLPPLILLATYAVTELIGELRRGRWRAFAIQASALLVAVLFVNLPPGDPQRFRNDAFSYVRLGSIFIEREEYDLAEDAYRSALKEVPALLSAHYQLATILQYQNKLDEAIVHYRKALASPPKLSIEDDRLMAQVHHKLAGALEQSGHPEQATGHHEAAARLDVAQRKLDSFR